MTYKLRTIKAGEYIILTCGAYSDYTITGLFLVKKDLDPAVLEKEFNVFTLGKGPYDYKFITWLNNQGYIEELDSIEMSMERSSKISDLFPKEKV